jgi:FAD/FMN-containing dehydrogenase
MLLTNGQLTALAYRAAIRSITGLKRSTSMATQHASAVVHEAVVADFRNTLRGELLTPGAGGYDTARTIWNAMIDHRPALIARCRGAADVMAAVNFARDHGLTLSIKGGGHNVSGKAVCNDGLMIDLSLMKGIRVDPTARTVQAQAGVLWSELDQETGSFGLATPGGQISTTGIAGLTLGGGQSWLTGKYGFAVDNLLSIDIVTADGMLRHASADEEPDLFWAVRGAGHNFGVVTSLEYLLHPVSTVLGGMVIHPFERAADVLRFHQEFTATAPDDVTCAAGILTAPDGTLVSAMVACYSGALDEGERVLAPLRNFGPPIADTIAPLPYTVMQTLLDGAFPYGRLNYWKSGLTSRVSDDMIDILVRRATEIPSPFSAILAGHFGGFGSRVAKQATAYYHRDLVYDVLMVSSWEDPAATDINVQWTRACYEEVARFLSRGIYVNDMSGDESNERVRHAYGENYERLAALKTQYDPTNLFRLNQNIAPG